MEDSQPKRAIQRVLGYIERNSLVVSVAIVCTTLLAWKLISVATESPYRYETLKRYGGGSGRILGEEVYRIDDRTGEMWNISRVTPASDNGIGGWKYLLFAIPIVLVGVVVWCWMVDAVAARRDARDGGARPHAP